MIPAAVLIYRDTPPMREKVAEKTMLRTIKTALKPRIKLRVPAMSLGLALGSWGLMPPRMLR
jgi:hypothetical protein